MKCPFCLVSFHDQDRFAYLGEDKEGHWGVLRPICSNCGKMVVILINSDNPYHTGNGRYEGFSDYKSRVMVRPKMAERPVPPKAVPREIADEFAEACLVLADSPAASAALSRRCLQHVLRTAGSVKAGNLADEIQQVMDSGTLPTHLLQSIDAVRNIGNFAAHPSKSSATGEIVAVEPHEAEWNLDVLEALFDFYFVQPAIISEKRAALDAKLHASGRQAMK